MANLIVPAAEADVLIFEFQGNFYLARGEVHLEAILYGSENASFTTCIQTAPDWQHVLDHWENMGGSLPWILNEKIVERIQRDLRQQNSISFNA